jgi:hypothetical protein
MDHSPRNLKIYRRGDVDRPRVLLLDEGWAASLYLAHGLSRAGCDVRAITFGPIDRYFLGSFLTQLRAPIPPGGAAYAEFVDRTVEEYQPTHVLPMTDNLLYWAWSTEAPWRRLVYPPTEPRQRELLLDKFELSTYVSGLGVSIPQSVRVRSEAELKSGLEALGLPSVVKGVTGFGGTQVRIVETESQAMSAWRALTKDGSDLFLQRYIKGPTRLGGGLFHEGRAIRIYTTEKMEVYPPRTGPAVRVRSTRDADLLDQLLTVFRGLRWSGIASADFVRGPDGRHYFLEVNPRPWGSISGAANAGVDFFTPLAQALRGNVPEPDLTFRDGVNATMFPDHLHIRLHGGGIRALVRMALDPTGWHGIPWRKPGIAMHLLRRLYRDWREETRVPGSIVSTPVAEDGLCGTPNDSESCCETHHAIGIDYRVDDAPVHSEAAVHD